MIDPAQAIEILKHASGCLSSAKTIGIKFDGAVRMPPLQAIDPAQVLEALRLLDGILWSLANDSAFRVSGTINLPALLKAAGVPQ